MTLSGPTNASDHVLRRPCFDETMRGASVQVAKLVVHKEPQNLVFTVPLCEPMPPQYLLCCDSDKFLGSYCSFPLTLRHLILPDRYTAHTELLPLNPLPVTILKESRFINLYKSFTHFNAVQTQIFFTLFHTDENVLLGAPTGSGKTVAAELAFFRVFQNYPDKKCVYIAPLKALVRERIVDWKERLEKQLGKSVVELTGDVTPDARAIATSDVIVTTPEKWDGISRSWQTRSYVKDVVLIVIDEIHLLGEERGPVLETIVSRTNFIRTHTNQKVRVVGLSTALANAGDLAGWLGIKKIGLFNFKPAVRPVPLEVHISGFAGKYYCPRMATMNKPAFQAINNYSPDKPVLIFVASRRQTRVTGQDLISYLAGGQNPTRWLHMTDNDLDAVLERCRDPQLKLILAFGIGMHHAGLQESDRTLVEELFVKQKIQVLICTATLAWGVNFPAHLVIVKGTEYFDGKQKRYVDFPITDVLQMMGRAGRPQFDDSGVACIFVHDVKKDFYKKFLYEPFPVESCLMKVLPEHLNAEIVAGTVCSVQDAREYITLTYFFKRLQMNPVYYGLSEVTSASVNKFLSSVVNQALLDLSASYCVAVADDQRTLVPQTLARIASYYYLSHLTVRMFKNTLTPDCTLLELLKLLTDVPEYAEIPVRHNEDNINAEISKNLPVPVDPTAFDSSHVKTHLLYQSHFCRMSMPSTDYVTDLKSVLDQSVRIIQAMIDVAADQGWMSTTVNLVNLLQMVVQARWITDPPISTLPSIELHFVKKLRYNGKVIETIPELRVALKSDPELVMRCLNGLIDITEAEDIASALDEIPDLAVQLRLSGWREGERQPFMKLVESTPASSTAIDVHANQEHVLQVNLTRLNPRRRNELRRNTRRHHNGVEDRPDKQGRAYAPRFPKIKDEGWFLLLFDPVSVDLVALKRVGFVRGVTNAQLVFVTPDTFGPVTYVLYIMSDSYLGIDQQYDVNLNVIAPSVEAQMNTELED